MYLLCMCIVKCVYMHSCIPMSISVSVFTSTSVYVYIYIDIDIDIDRARNRHCRSPAETITKNTLTPRALNSRCTI